MEHALDVQTRGNSRIASAVAAGMSGYSGRSSAKMVKGVAEGDGMLWGYLGYAVSAMEALFAQGTRETKR
jgi:hypothetical protein